MALANWWFALLLGQRSSLDHPMEALADAEGSVFPCEEHQMSGTIV